MTTIKRLLVLTVLLPFTTLGQGYTVSVNTAVFQPIAVSSLSSWEPDESQQDVTSLQHHGSFVNMPEDQLRYIPIAIPFSFPVGGQQYDTLQLMLHRGQCYWENTSQFVQFFFNGILLNDSISVESEEVYSGVKNNRFIVELHQQITLQQEQLTMFTQLQLSPNGEITTAYRLSETVFPKGSAIRLTDIQLAVVATPSPKAEDLQALYNLTGDRNQYQLLDAAATIQRAEADSAESTYRFRFDVNNLRIAFSPVVALQGQTNTPVQTMQPDACPGTVQWNYVQIAPVLPTGYNRSANHKTHTFARWKQSFSNYPKGMYQVTYKTREGRQCQQRIIKH